jgi:hypothetical protein
LLAAHGRVVLIAVIGVIGVILVANGATGLA